MSDIRIKMAKDLRDMSDMVGDLHWMAAKAVEDLIKKDARIAELEGQRDRFMASIERKHKLMDEDAAEIDQLRAELAAIKAQYLELAALSPSSPLTIATPVSEAKAQANKPSYASQMAKRWGSVMPKAQGVEQWPEADEIMQMAFEEGHPADDASGYYFELEEFDLFIERLMSEVARLNAAPVQQPKCKTCNDNGRIGGPSFYAPDEGGEPCPDCSATVQQVSVPDGWRPVPISSLSNILRLIDPAPVRLPTGETMVFKNPHAAEALTRISAEVRAMLDAAPVSEAKAQGVELDHYDAGLLNDFGGGNVDWWQDYIRAELGRAHDFYQSQFSGLNAAPVQQVSVPDGWRLVPVELTQDMHDAGRAALASGSVPMAKVYRAMLSAAPAAPAADAGLVEALEEWLADYDSCAANPDFEPFKHVAERVARTRAALAAHRAKVVV